MRPDARPQTRKNRKRIRWNTLRIFRAEHDADGRRLFAAVEWSMSDKLLVQKLSIDNGRDREKQDRNREHHPSDQGKRALENIPLGVAVEEGQQHQHGPKEAGQYASNREICPNSPENIFRRRCWNKNKKYHSGSG